MRFSSLTRSMSISTALCLTTLAGAQDNLVHVQANMALGLEDSQLIRINQPMSVGANILLQVDLGGLPMTLDLAPQSVRTSGFKVVLIGEDGVERAIESGPVRTLWGSILEDPGSVVSASLLEDGLYARISLSSGDDYWLQPIASKVRNAAPGDYVLYHNDDTIDVVRRCGSDLLKDQIPAPETTGGGTTYGPGNFWICEIGCDSDANYYNDYGSAAAVQARIESVINGLNVQYLRDVDIRHDISHLIIRTSNGPYTSTDPSALLNQFRSEWNSNQSGVQRDVAHLFTGKNLQGGVIGVAWLGVICNKSYGYGLVESDCCGSFSCTTDLSAHELGHNWNAGHCSCSGWTMNPYITCGNRFISSSSIPAIENHRDSRSCLDQGSNGTILADDDFESGTLGSQWNCSTASRCVIKKKAQNKNSSGKWGLQLKKAVDIDLAVSTVGYATIDIYVSERSQNYESTEFINLDWFDGASWNTANQWQQKGWRDRMVTLPAGAGNNAAFQLRFSCNAKGKQERSKVDDVLVVGN
ncbi:MAG: hypothetical protein CMJ98_13680 [Planctomycetes bacterium]|nr:hypothetical protein [Planctomycetota bacterium]